MPAESSLEVATSPAEHYAPGQGRFASYPQQQYHEKAPASYPSKEYFTSSAYVGSPPPPFQSHQPIATANDRKPPKWRERHPLLLAALSALVAAIIVGGAVGGGLGASMTSGCDASLGPTQTSSPQQQSQATKTVTLTTSANARTTNGGLLVDYVAATPSAIASVALDCSALDSQSWSSSTGSDFIISCPETYGGGDLASVTAYNIYDCMEACSALNVWQGKPGWCSRVAFSSSIGEDHAPYPQSNCWLKSNESSSVTPGPDTASAKLIAS